MFDFPLKSGSRLNSPSTPNIGPNNSDERLKIRFTDLPQKQISDSSEIKDPTLISKKQSRVSYYSQMNSRLSQRSVALPIYDVSCAPTNQTKYNAKATLNRTFREIISSLWSVQEQNQHIYCKFTEKYLSFDKIQDKQIMQFIQTTQYALEILNLLVVPLSMNSFFPSILCYIFLSLQLICCNLLFRQLAPLTYIQRIICSIIQILIVVNFNNTMTIVIYILCYFVQFVYIKQRMINLTLMDFIVFEIIYENFICNLYILVYDHSYLEGITLAVSNTLPFGHVQMESNYTNVIVQFVSFLIQLVLISKFVQSQIKTNVSVFQDFLKESDVNKNTIASVTTQIQQFSDQATNRNLKIINPIIQMLPSDMQNQLNRQLKGSILQQTPFFKCSFSINFLNQLSDKSTVIQVDPSQYLLKNHQLDDNIYILFKGTMQVYTCNDRQKYPLCIVSNELIGIENLMTNCGHKLSYQALEYCHLFKISFLDFTDTIKYHAKDLEIFHSLKQEALFGANQTRITACQICKSQSHTLDNCPSYQFIPDRYSIFQDIYVMYVKREDKNGGPSRRNFEHQKIQNKQHNKQINFGPYDTNSFLRIQLMRKKTTMSNINSSKKTKSVDLLPQFTNPESQVFDQEYEGVSRNQVVKSTLQTAGFHSNENHVLGEDSIFNIPNAHRAITQNSNTFKSSSGQTYLSQKSLSNRQNQRNHITAPPRTTEQKVTFQLTPNDNKQLLTVAQGYRVNNRASTERPQPIISDDSGVHSPQTAVEPLQQHPTIIQPISNLSIGLSSIEDNVLRSRQPSFQNRKAKVQSSSAISPGKLTRGKGSGTYSQFSSVKLQHQSDFELVTPFLFKDDIDIDAACDYAYFQPSYNINYIVKQLIQ